MKNRIVRQRILDTTVACIAEYGWSGTNISVIARRMRMTRGKLQYYFPTLEDVRRAAVAHLYEEWQKKYWGPVEQAKSPERFQAGIDRLWSLMQDPLHTARRELEAASRTDAELRILLEKVTANDDEQTFRHGAEAFPSMARHRAAFNAARTFVFIFMEGLSQHRFTGDSGTAKKVQLDLLRLFAISYWRSLGVKGLPAGPALTLAALQYKAEPETSDANRKRALDLIGQAQALLSQPD